MDDEISAQLFELIKEDQVDGVAEIIESNIDPNESFNSIPEGNLCFGILPIPFLNVACSYGAVNTVNYLIEIGASPDMVDGNGNTAFIAAASSGNTDIGNILLSNGSSLDEKNLNNVTALHIAAQYGNTQFCDSILQCAGIEAINLLNFKDSEYQTPIFYSAYKNQLETTEYLCSVGADCRTLDINGNSVIHVAIQNGAIEIAMKLLQNTQFPINIINHKKMTVLLEAALTGNLELFTLIVSKGANPFVLDIHNDNIVILAAISGNYFLLDYILVQGGFNLDHQNDYGYTALHYAAAYGPLNNVKRLIAAGCHSINNNNSGWCPIHLAIKHQHADIVEYMLHLPDLNPTLTAPGFLTSLHLAARIPNYNILNMILQTNNYDTNIPDSIGWSALHYAASKGSLKMIQLLLGAKGDPHSPDNEGRTVYDILRARGSTKILNFVLKNYPEN
ncbi:hypothetical protein TVAG_454530 [Trichomonas vaginalis G3]|uniref:Uncharacterized protein n=1 Tax=Trichomonas vaginalis (strain ATCC PRA-98 / G3) TaxID=412133 RepID=A2EU66_TRIV3|nr:spectrin binding [Trichomonas vaginalis G3]EAY03814.1 hypothetical protein TVAG_454530 [Trichomonas vaginalis G3]KAI5552664.1 spectrin binding [Trichomonas vaginalis G3]|eukprot:XP_001316037.1 hypothetical protein [Trichomonas vaginalis G3]